LRIVYGADAENLCRENSISREAQDEYSLLSQQRAAAAYQAGKFQNEIAPIEIKGRKGVELFDRDDHMRPDTTIEVLAKLRPSFGKRASLRQETHPVLSTAERP